MLQSLVALPALFAAIIVGTDRRIVRELRLAGATTRERAVNLETSPIRRMRMRRLVAIGALEVVGGNRYHLDEAGWRRFQRTRRRRVLVTTAAVAVLVTVFWLRQR